MKAVIDRFEGDLAVIFIGEEELKAEIPRQLLPAGASEGSWLKISFELNPEGTKIQETKIKGLLEKLKKKKQ